MRTNLQLVITVLLAVMASACDSNQTPADRFLNDGEAVKRGQQLFVGMCGAHCHGLRADNREAPFLFDCEWKHGGTSAEVFATISNGVPKTQMLPFGGKLPDEDIWKLVAFLRAASRCK